MFAADFEGTTLKSEAEVFSHYHYRGMFNNVKFDFSHHGKMGGMRNTRKAYAVRLAQDVMDKYKDKGETPPDVVVRSHNHTRADSGHNWPTFAMFTPAWQMHTEFAYRIGAENDPSDIGADVFLCHPMNINNHRGYGAGNGNFVWHPFEYKPEQVRQLWEAASF
jgi:hypothetical protein